jgi:hypothetical protein
MTDLYRWLQDFKGSGPFMVDGQKLWASKRKTPEQRQRPEPMRRAHRAVRSAFPSATVIDYDGLAGKIWVQDKLVCTRDGSYNPVWKRDILASIPDFQPVDFDQALAVTDTS